MIYATLESARRWANHMNAAKGLVGTARIYEVSGGFTIIRSHDVKTTDNGMKLKFVA